MISCTFVLDLLCELYVPVNFRENSTKVSQEQKIMFTLSDFAT